MPGSNNGPDPSKWRTYAELLEADIERLRQVPAAERMVRREAEDRARRYAGIISLLTGEMSEGDDESTNDWEITDRRWLRYAGELRRSKQERDEARAELARIRGELAGITDWQQWLIRRGWTSSVGHQWKRMDGFLTAADTDIIASEVAAIVGTQPEKR